MSAAQRAARLDARRAQRGDRRRDDLDLLAAERAAFAGMRVEPGDRDDRRGDAEIADAAPRASRARHGRSRPPTGFRSAARSARWIVTGTTRSCGQASIITGPSADPGELGEEFGVPGMAETRPDRGVLVDRVGHERGGAAVLHVGDGGLDRADH